MYFCSAYSEEYPAVKRVIEYGRPWSREWSTDYALNLFDETKDNRWEDCFIYKWNATENLVKEKMFSPLPYQEDGREELDERKIGHDCSQAPLDERADRSSMARVSVSVRIHA